MDENSGIVQYNTQGGCGAPAVCEMRSVSHISNIWPLPVLQPKIETQLIFPVTVPVVTWDAYLCHWDLNQVFQQYFRQMDKDTDKYYK